MSLNLLIVEPAALLLLWQPADEAGQSRARRAVGKITKSEDVLEFRYLHGTTDFDCATAEGFRGFPAFDLKAEATRDGVLEALVRRLPPRKREDFSKYLERHCLPSPFAASDFALLAYTGARLPSDGFSLVPLFSSEVQVLDYVAEVSGTRHVFPGDTSSLKIGQIATFVIEPGNPFDPDAVAVYCDARKIGFVNRAMRQTFNHWLDSRNLTAVICRLNGKPERPLIYLHVSVRLR